MSLTQVYNFNGQVDSQKLLRDFQRVQNQSGMKSTSDFNNIQNLQNNKQHTNHAPVVIPARTAQLISRTNTVADQKRMQPPHNFQS